VARELHRAHDERVRPARAEADDERRLVDAPEPGQRLLGGRGDDLGAQVQEHEQVAQVGGEERHLVRAAMRTFSAPATASIAASTSEREVLRAVSSTLRWSAAIAVSNSLWSSENSGSAAGGRAPRRRQAVRALVAAAVLLARGGLQLGKPSKPSACEKRTTVELEVLARRASSSAVWKATSSRWSTMYCATSFCEREKSSNRAWM
jgi:hypothetical protein